MIYICVPARDEAATVGLLLWKIRKVFEEFPREYQVLVTDDGSQDGTGEVLERYRNVLPLTATTNGKPVGYAAAVQQLLEAALERSDRPKRDCAILIPADFTADAGQIPEFVKRLERGVDLVVGERNPMTAPGRPHRWARRLIPWMLRHKISLPGITDVTSGFLACRLISVRNALRRGDSKLIATDGWLANAELAAKLAAGSRKLESVSVEERNDLRQRPSRANPWFELRRAWTGRGSITIPPAQQQDNPSGDRRRGRGRSGRPRAKAAAS